MPSTRTRNTRITLAAALVTSSVGLAMAAASAIDRGATLVDRTLIVALACVLVMGAHLLPAITSTWKGRALWLVCLLLTAWGHAVFFTSSAQRAGQIRADAVKPSSAATALQDELSSTQARPVTAVAADLATARLRTESARSASTRCNPATHATECRRRAEATRAAEIRASALADELDQARHSAELRQRITTEAAGHDSARASATADPVAAIVSRMTGADATALTTVVSVLSSLTLELMAALLWSSALSEPPHEQEAPTRTHPETAIAEVTAPQPNDSVHAVQPAGPGRRIEEVPLPGCLCPMHPKPDDDETNSSDGSEVTGQLPPPTRSPPESTRTIDRHFLDRTHPIQFHEHYPHPH